jgi:Zn-dependent protease
MARFEGIEIEEIVLHPFGGLARLRSEPENPRAEFRIAVAGPAASFVFAILAFGGAKVAALGDYVATVVVFFFLAWGNLLLAVFNLMPGYRWTVVGSCAQSFGAIAATSHKRRAWLVFVAC